MAAFLRQPLFANLSRQPFLADDDAGMMRDFSSPKFTDSFSTRPIFPMHLHYLQHVPFEGPAAIKAWAKDRGHELTSHRVFGGGSLPEANAMDGLCVMGGPMGVHDSDKFPWLDLEIDYIRRFVDSGKPLLGICLGAQLIAHAVGARVSKNPHKEIGWFAVHSDPQAQQHPLGCVIPDGLSVFHWHGDTFAIPDSAIPLASSAACQNQAFVLGDSVLGLQFHLEATQPWAERLIAHCSDELDGSTYVQTGAEMLSDPQRFVESNRVMAQLLDTLFA